MDDQRAQYPNKGLEKETRVRAGREQATELGDKGPGGAAAQGRRSTAPTCPRRRGICESSEPTVPRGFGPKSLQLGLQGSHTTQHVTSQDATATPGVTLADSLTQTHPATHSVPLPSRAAHTASPMHTALPSLPKTSSCRPSFPHAQ